MQEIIGPFLRPKPSFYSLSTACSTLLSTPPTNSAQLPPTPRPPPPLTPPSSFTPILDIVNPKYPVIFSLVLTSKTQLSNLFGAFLRFGRPFTYCGASPLRNSIRSSSRPPKAPQSLIKKTSRSDSTRQPICYAERSRELY